MPTKITHILLFYTFQLLSSEPRRFRSLVEESLRRHVAAVNELADAGELEIPEKIKINVNVFRESEECLLLYLGEEIR